MEGRKERQGYPFHHLDHWGMMNLVDFKAGKYPGTQSDPKFPVHLVRCSQMSTQRCSTLASRCAAGLSSLRRSEASMSWVHSFRKGWWEHKKERPVPSAQQEARVYLTGAGPLSRVQCPGCNGNHCRELSAQRTAAGTACPRPLLAHMQARVVLEQLKVPGVGSGGPGFSSISIKAIVRRRGGCDGRKGGADKQGSSPPPQYGQDCYVFLF